MLFLILNCMQPEPEVPLLSSPLNLPQPPCNHHEATAFLCSSHYHHGIYKLILVNHNHHRTAMSLLHRLHTAVTQPQSQPNQQTPQTPIFSPRAAAARTRDPNSTDYRYNVAAKCIYERRLPGGSYITAHIQRLQSGYYDSPMVHEDLIDNVRFVAINFVFHPSRSNFRFKNAEIRIALHRDVDDHRPDIQVPVVLRKLYDGSSSSISNDGYQGGRAHHGSDRGSNSHALVPTHEQPGQGLDRQKQFKTSPPRFIRHAPHLLFGAISPETLNWNFNLAGSLGVTEGPANATFNPSGGMNGSYKMYEMMRIQGSIRGLHRWFDQTYDIEDGEIVWTLEENRLQKSGLPREFTFVMLLTTGSGGGDGSGPNGLGPVKLDIDISPVVGGFMGMKNASYPSVVTHMLRYQPLHKDLVDLNQDVGQRFMPELPGKGFNFALLAKDFDEFVWLPGTTWSTKEGGAGDMMDPGPSPQPADEGGKTAKDQAKQPKQGGTAPQLSLLGAGDNTINLRVILDSARGSPVPALSHGNPNLKAQPSYGNNRGPSPLHRVPAPASATSSTLSKSGSKRRSITIVSSARQSGDHAQQQFPNNTPPHRNDKTDHRRVSRSPTLRRRTSRSSLDKEYHSSPPAPRLRIEASNTRPHTLHDPVLPSQNHLHTPGLARRPVSWYNHSTTPPPPRTANSEMTDTGTVIHHPPHSHSEHTSLSNDQQRPSQHSIRVKTRQAIVSQTPYRDDVQTYTDHVRSHHDTITAYPNDSRRASHQSDQRIKTRQAKVAQTPYPIISPPDTASLRSNGIDSAHTDSVPRYGDEDLMEAESEPDLPEQEVPIIAVPRKSSKRTSQHLLTSNADPRHSGSSNGSSAHTNPSHTSNRTSHIFTSTEAPPTNPSSATGASGAGTVIFSTPQQTTDRTTESSPPQQQGHPFARSTSGVFHDAEEELPGTPEKQTQASVPARTGLEMGEYDARNVF